MIHREVVTSETSFDREIQELFILFGSDLFKLINVELKSKRTKKTVE